MANFKPYDERPYRPCVGIMLFNNNGLVFSGKRIDNPNNAWQLPQGGIDEGETVVEAGYRELMEETSITSVDYIAEYPDWINYDVPHNLADKLWQVNSEGKVKSGFYLILMAKIMKLIFIHRIQNLLNGNGLTH